MSVKHERILLMLLTAINFTCIMDYVIIMPLGARLMETLSIGPAQFGKLVAAYSLAAALTGVLGGFFLDRFERKQSLLFLYLGFFLSTVACGLSTSYPMLLASRFAAGAFSGVAGSVVYAMVSDVIPPERRGRGMGLVMSAFPLASIMGIPTALWITKFYGWQAPFLMLASASILVLGLCVRFLPPVPQHPQADDPIKQMKAILSHPVHIRGFCLSAVLVFAGGCVIPFMASSMVANNGFTEHELGFIYLFGGAATLLSTRVVGICSDRFDKVHVIAWATVFAASAAIIITQLHSHSVLLSLCCTTLFMVGMASRFPPTMALITNAVEQRYRGGFLSVNSAVQQAANSLATTIAGWMLVRGGTGELIGYGRVGILSAIFMGLTFFMSYRLRQIAPGASRPSKSHLAIAAET